MKKLSILLIALSLTALGTASAQSEERATKGESEKFNKIEQDKDKESTKLQKKEVPDAEMNKDLKAVPKAQPTITIKEYHKDNEQQEMKKLEKGKLENVQKEEMAIPEERQNKSPE